MAISTMVLDWWIATFGTAKRGLGWAGQRPIKPIPCCTKWNNPPINGQCINFILLSVIRYRCTRQQTSRWHTVVVRRTHCGGYLLFLPFSSLPFPLLPSLVSFSSLPLSSSYSSFPLIPFFPPSKSSKRVLGSALSSQRFRADRGRRTAFGASWGWNHALFYHLRIDTFVFLLYSLHVQNGAEMQKLAHSIFLHKFAGNEMAKCLRCGGVPISF